jgi:DNA-binding MarR family transcriptional regulator
LESSRVLTSNLDIHLKKEEITFQQSLLLVAILLDGKEEITPGKISKALNLSKASVSQILSQFESKGLLKRALKENDARSFNVFLTANGFKKANNLVKILGNFDKSLENSLGSHKNSIIKLNEILHFENAPS